MTSKRLMVIGAHPDDAEFCAAGVMVKWHRRGHKVGILSLTDGSAGHQFHQRPELRAIRYREAKASADKVDAELAVWDEVDGCLTPSLTLRHKLIRAIRAFAPDLIISHRQADYHPDHRATAQLVHDACYLLCVPNIEPDVPPLAALPPVLMCADHFSYPRPFRADWIVDTSTELDAICSLLHCHASQVYEWLPHTMAITVPDTNRLEWLRAWYAHKPAKTARQFAPHLAHAEAFEISEYGGPFKAQEFEFVHE